MNVDYKNEYKGNSACGDLWHELLKVPKNGMDVVNKAVIVMLAGSVGGVGVMCVVAGKDLKRTWEFNHHGPAAINGKQASLVGKEVSVAGHFTFLDTIQGRFNSQDAQN